jgi:hypothetical protein
MNSRRHLRNCFLVGTLILLSCSISGSAQTNSDPAKDKPQETAAQQDGQHDFDFNIGTWKTHIRYLHQPLTGPATWVELNGTVTVRKVWNGRAQMEEIEADGSTGHFEGLTLFLYDPQSHQWSQTFANSNDGTMAVPMIGEFRNGRGELVAQEPYHGRTALIRGVWSDITPDSHHFEESFSNDGGKTWEPSFIATLTREKN